MKQHLCLMTFPVVCLCLSWLVFCRTHLSFYVSLWDKKVQWHCHESLAMKSAYVTLTSERPQMSSTSRFWSASFRSVCAHRWRRRQDDLLWPFPENTGRIRAAESHFLRQRDKNAKCRENRMEKTNLWCPAAPCDFQYSFLISKYILKAFHSNYSVILTL